MNYQNRQYSHRANLIPRMNAQVQARAKPDDTRERIMETAEALFRRLGFAKTAVADIAAELKMSPANIYRFFDSKNAIVEAICRRCLSAAEEKAWWKRSSLSRSAASSRRRSVTSRMMATWCVRSSIRIVEIATSAGNSVPSARSAWISVRCADWEERSPATLRPKAS